MLRERSSQEQGQQPSTRHGVCVPFSSLGKVSYVAVLVCILQKGEMRLGEVVT